MKNNYLRTTFVALALLAMIWSCQKEIDLKDVAMEGAPTLQGLSLDTICDGAWTVPLASASGDEIINYCGVNPCTAQIPWGYVTYLKYSDAGVPILNLEVHLGPGWLAQGYHVVVTPPGPIPTNGQLPQVGTGWTSEPFVNFQNAFLVNVPLDGSLNGASCFARG